MPFQSPDVHCTINRNGRYVLTAPMVYKGRDDVFIVPTGFVTDLASIPSFLTWLVPIAGLADRAAILHDSFCVGLENGEPAVSARDADNIFRRTLRELGVPTVRRWLMWAGVRWGALGTPSRRPGWLRDAPAVIGISVLALPIVLPASVVVGLGLLLYTVAEMAARCAANVRGKR